MDYTKKQIKDWRAFERVRKAGKYNMLTAQARNAAGLDRDEYRFVINHYEALAAAAEGEAK